MNANGALRSDWPRSCTSAEPALSSTERWRTQDMSGAITGGLVGGPLGERLTVLIVLVFGILVAPTGFGQGVLDVVGELVSGINDSSR